MPLRRPFAELLELLNERSPSLAYDLVNPLARVLTVAREVCGGDLDKALLMIAVTLRASGHPEYRKLMAAAMPAADPLPSFSANMRSLAQSTGIPKETVRRKVQQLIDLGWIVREGRSLRYSVQGYHAVAEIRDAITRMYVRGYEVIRLIDDAEPAA